MVTDEMVEKACLAYWGEKNMASMFARKTREGVMQSMRNALEAALSTDAEPVAEIVSAHGDPEAFGERELVARVDIQKFPYGTKLYAEPVKTAPSVAVKAKPKRDDYLISTLEGMVEDNIWSGWAIKQAIEIIRGTEDELPYHCDVCSTAGHGDAKCSPLCDRSALSAQVQDVAGWQSMDSAPKDGKHCLLAVRSSCFVYAVQGAFMSGKWENAAGLGSEPLCWMPLTRIPLVYLPWTEEFSTASPASKHGDAE